MINIILGIVLAIIVTFLVLVQNDHIFLSLIDIRENIRKKDWFLKYFS